MNQNAEKVSPMSNEGRNAYVIRQLTDTYLLLLKEKPASEISISELCEQAGVGRASFYRNFENREDILRNFIGQMFGAALEECFANEDRQLHEQIGAVFSHFIDHRSFYQLLGERKLVYLLKDVLTSICGPKPEQSKLEAYASAFVSYALYGWIETWFARGMQETAEEMAELFRNQGM